MNNPDAMPIYVKEQRQWLLARKAETGLSWEGLSNLSGIPAGTLSTFGGATYQGRNDRVARDVSRYRQLVDSQAERSQGMVLDPGYFETKTSQRIKGQLVVAHMGRMIVCATGPGTGKTMAMRDYQASVANCWAVTMRQTTKTPNAMIVEVLRVVAPGAKAGWGAQLSRLVDQYVRGKRGLLIIDEANHLSLEALEEVRSWHDATGVGIALLGNEELAMRIQSGPRRDAFARLNSRLASTHIQNLPDPEDIHAFCDAWGVVEPAMRRMLARIAMQPGSGGLRECRQIVEQASLLAAGENRELTFADLRDAQSTRATRLVLE